MPPWLAVVALGRTRQVPLPIPLFLAWPLLALVWFGLACAHELGPKPPPPTSSLYRINAFFRAYCQLTGLVVDVRSKDQLRVLFWVL